MLLSFALILVIGLLASKFFTIIKLPGLLGMLLVGILLGPYSLGVLDDELLSISHYLRTFALIVILLRAGLGLKRESLVKVGGVAIRLSAIPCIFEGVSVMITSWFLLGLDFAQAGMLGFIIAAVSPAVVVPGMIALREEGYGEDKQISTMILAGASVDDVFAITLFSSFLAMGVGDETNVLVEIAKIPIGVGVGIIGGLVLALFLIKIYDVKFLNARNTEKLLLLLGISIIYFEIGEHFGIAALLGIMTIGLVILEKRESAANKFSVKLAKIWVFAQIILFTLVGAKVDIGVAIQAGTVGIVIIVVGLMARSIGVFLATIRTKLNIKERIFCIIAYMPKATVQAAIGAIPLALGVGAGETILAVSVLAILITAPLGAIGIKYGAPILLKKTS